LKEYLGLRSDDPLDRSGSWLSRATFAERLRQRYLYLKASRDGGISNSQMIPTRTNHLRRKTAYAPDGYLLYYDFVGHPLSGIETVADSPIRVA
jgi:hypothetical protein